MMIKSSSTIIMDVPSKLSSVLICTVFIFMATTARLGLCGYISHSCPNNFTAPLTPRQSQNIKGLLKSLSTNADENNSFHYTTTNRAISARSEVFFGLFLCRGDVPAGPNCSRCVAAASDDAERRCSAAMEAVVWHDECMLRYSHSAVFAILSLVPKSLSRALSGGDNQIVLTAQSLASEIAVKAASSEGGRFAVGKKLVLGSEVVIYGLAQCTPDLSKHDCIQCFVEATKDIEGPQRKILLPSCYLMYDVQRFFNATFLPSDPISPNSGKTSKMSKVEVIVSIVAPLLVVVLLSASVILLRRRAKKKYKALFPHEKSLNDMTTVESLQFDFRSIQISTNNFSDDNKLGKGGFGEVYKGTLHDGREIAVKRLSKHSAQGEAEFKNEVVLVAKLQHRNLARLFGFCLEGEEKLLIYEYVPNKSLDSILFDTKKQCKLNWPIRCKIIEGIARGVMYLHEDSRLKIIHRDLKASNVLLDNNMNAKVSDFGMAKMFVGVDQTHGNTKRVVGTYGYMAPEYAMEGLYSIKSDVYSFGVLLLEILSGRRNSSFRISDCAPSLVAHAWQLWKEKKAFDLIDSSLKNPQNESELLRYVHIGLLCVQEEALLRPAMSSIVLMLKSESQSLSQPQRPAFIARTSNKTSQNNEIIAVDSCSVNGMTVSEFLPR